VTVENLRLGGRGKLSLGPALQHVADEHPAVASLDLIELRHRVRAQIDVLEQKR
jgi:hypothetical protein